MVDDLVERNETLGLKTDVDDDVLVGDLDDGAGHDHLFGGQRLGGVLLGSLLAVEALERLGKVIGVILGLVLVVRGWSGLGRNCLGGMVRRLRRGLSRPGVGGDFGRRRLGGRHFFGRGWVKCGVQGCALGLDWILVVIGHSNCSGIQWNVLFDTARVRLKLHLFSGATGHRRRCGLRKTFLEDFGGSGFRTTVCDWIPHAAVQYQV